MITVEQCVSEVQEDMKSEGTNNYEACYHSELYLDEFASMDAVDAANFFLEVLAKDKSLDCWVAAVLNKLYENTDQYNLSSEWFDEILKHESLRIF